MSRPYRIALRHANGAGADEDVDDPCPPGMLSRRYRVSLLQILINSNQTGGQAAVEDMADYLREELFQPAAFEEILVLRSRRPDRHLIRVEVMSPSVEEGPSRRFIHAHFLLRVTHIDELDLGMVAPALKAHVRRKTRFVGAYASVTLLDGRAENYALKEAYYCEENN